MAKFLLYINITKHSIAEVRKYWVATQIAVVTPSSLSREIIQTYHEIRRPMKVLIAILLKSKILHQQTNFLQKSI